MKSKKTLTIQEYNLPVVIRKETTGGYVAQCSIWSDCYAQGETIEEVINEISTVASSLIELYNEEGLEVPLTLRKTTQKPANSLTLTFPVIVSTN